MAGDVKVAVVSASLASGGGGTTDFTKTGFGTPKACIVLLTFDTTDNTSAAAEGRMSIGFSDFTSDFCITQQDEDASAKVDCDALRSNTKCYILLDAGAVIQCHGTASTITDGVRLTNVANTLGAVFATVIMFGGADLNISLVRTAINSSQDGTATISHTGFTDGNDKLIFFIGTDVSAEDNANTGINNSFGVCHATGSDAGGWTFVQRCIGWASDHNNTVGSPSAVISTDRVLDIITETGGQDWGLEVTAFSNSGGTWTVTTRDNGSGAGMEVYSLALDLDDRKAKVSSVDGPTSGTTWVVTGVGFIPQYVGLSLTELTGENLISTGGTAGSMGLSSNAGSGEETCHSWYNENAVGTTNTNNLFRSRVMDFRDQNGVTVLQDHSHSSFDSDGFTTTINIENEITARKWLYVAIEEAAAPVTVVVTALETDTAGVIQPLKTIPLTLALETDASFVVNPTRGALLGTALETDSSFILGRAKLKALTTALETDTSIAVVPNRSIPLMVALEADSAFVLTPLKSVAITLASELDTAFVLVVNTDIPLATALETDSAFIIVPSQGVEVAVGTALETDTAITITPLRSLPLGVSLETDAALALTPLRTRALVTALETDNALAIPHSKSVSLQTALESDLAFVITPFQPGAPAVAGWLIPVHRRRRRS